MAASTSTTAPVRMVALGGLGEIGLNLMAIECAGRAIVIDCGVMFPDEPALGLGTYIPEMAWLGRSRVALEAVVLTHAHDDHIGALAHLLRRFKVPVYGTDITLAFTRRRLADAEFDDPVDLRTIAPRVAFEAGPFTVEPIRVTQSTPNSIALASPSWARKALRCCSRIRPTSSAPGARARKVRSSRYCASSHHARVAG